MLPETVRTMQNLEACGMRFVSIPSGTYSVGFSGATDQLLAKPPQVQFVTPTATLQQQVTVAEFFISKDVVRLGQVYQMLVHPDFAWLKQQILPEQLARIADRIIAEKTVEIEPRISECVYGERGKIPEKRRIAQQRMLDPVLTLPAIQAHQVAHALNAALPRWDEWEIAARGPQGWLYPWGNVLELDQLSLEIQDYSVDDESAMGYYCYDQEVAFIRSFGPYVKKPSPYGLIGLAWYGQEWNRGDDKSLLPNEPYIVRSIADLGAMAFMIPGIRPNTWDGGSQWAKNNIHLAFSGPALPCYAPQKLKLTGYIGGTHTFQYKEAGFRLVFR